MYTYQTDKLLYGKGDYEFLQGVFQKLLLNFSWWANRKDPQGRNLFEGGFLGLDNIGVFDRSAALPTGGFLEQADGTSWMALFCQNMLTIALELAQEDPAYEELAMKFVEHFFWIAGAMDRLGENADELWDEEDGFFYDVLHLPDGSAQRLKVRSMVGLIAPVRRRPHPRRTGRTVQTPRRTHCLLPQTPSRTHRHYLSTGSTRLCWAALARHLQ